MSGRRARELVRASFERITIWSKGDPEGAEGGQVVDVEITARGGCSIRLRIHKETGGVV